MRILRSAAAVFVLALLFGLVMLCSSPSAYGQAKSVQQDKKERKIHKHDDDEDDNDGDEVTADVAKQATISMDSARAIALEKIQGTVIDEEMEKEHGRLQYAFDIRDSEGQVYDVEVDAITGKILQAIKDDEDDDDAAASAKKIRQIKNKKLTTRIAKTKPH